jgi:hypothetical protein
MSVQKSSVDKWKKIKKALGKLYEEYEPFIGDKDTYCSITDLNERSNNYLEYFYSQRQKLRAYVLKDKELTQISYVECKNSFFFWILWDMNTKDLNRNPEASVQAVLPYKHQLPLIEALQFSVKHIHVQKTRRQGASLICAVAYPLWLLLFGKDQHLFTTHKDLASLDVKGDETNTTFGKIRFALRRSMFFVESSLTINETKRLIYQSNSLDGSVLSPNTTVGFQANVIMVDELDPVCDSYPNKSATVFGAFATSCNRMILFSTYRSINYPFYKLYETHDDSTFDFITLDWHDHPLCNELWYKDACAKMGNNPVLIARELDHDPTKSVADQIFSNLTERHYFPVEYDDFSSWKKIIGADFGGGTSATVFICAFYSTNEKRLVLYRALKTTTMTEYQVKQWIESVGFGGVEIVGDVSAKASPTTPESSWKFLLRKVGFSFTPVDNRDMQASHNQINLALLNNEVLINKNEPVFRDFFTYKYDLNGVMKTSSSHTGDAFSYLYKFLYPIRSGSIEMI